MHFLTKLSFLKVVDSPWVSSNPLFEVWNYMSMFQMFCQYQMFSICIRRIPESEKCLKTLYTKPYIICDVKDMLLKNGKSFLSKVYSVQKTLGKKSKNYPLLDKSRSNGYAYRPKEYEHYGENLNKTPAEQRDIFRPKLFYNYINLRLENSQCTKKRQKLEEKKALIHLSPF